MESEPNLEAAQSVIDIGCQEFVNKVMSIATFDGNKIVPIIGIQNGGPILWRGVRKEHNKWKRITL